MRCDVVQMRDEIAWTMNKENESASGIIEKGENSERRSIRRTSERE